MYHPSKLQDTSGHLHYQTLSCNQHLHQRQSKARKSIAFLHRAANHVLASFHRSADPLDCSIVEPISCWAQRPVNSTTALAFVPRKRGSRRSLWHVYASVFWAQHFSLGAGRNFSQRLFDSSKDQNNAASFMSLSRDASLVYFSNWNIYGRFMNWGGPRLRKQTSKSGFRLLLCLCVRNNIAWNGRRKCQYPVETG